MSEDTKATYRLGLDKFRAWLTERDLETTRETVREWRDELREQHSPATANVRLAGMRSFYCWAVEVGRLAHNATQGVTGIKSRGTTRAHKRDELTAEEVKAVLATCEETPTRKRDRALIP